MGFPEEVSYEADEQDQVKGKHPFDQRFHIILIANNGGINFICHTSSINREYLGLRMYSGMILD
jgi:hypothetical protein